MTKADVPTKDELNKLAKEVRDLKKELSTMNRRIADSSKMPEILGTLSNSLTKQAVREQEIQMQPKVLGPEFVTVPVNLRFKSRFNQAFDIVQMIETNPNLIRVDKLDVLCDSPASGNAALHVVMEVSAVLTPEGELKP
jgi:Tfp pilus assembly protein PilO